MGLHEQSHRTYLNVSLGKLRQACTETTPKATSRVTKEGKTIWELVYTGISGKLSSVIFKDHPDYGRSWTLIIDDMGKEFAVKVPEESRAGIDLLKKLPNLKQGDIYSFTPYDFEVNGQRKSGLSIKDAFDTKIESYYQKFSEVNGKFKVENLHDFPTPDGDTNKYTKDDWKIYFIRVSKFLREKALEYLKSFKLKIGEVNSDAIPNFDAVKDDEDSIPF